MQAFFALLLAYRDNRTGQILDRAVAADGKGIRGKAFDEGGAVKGYGVIPAVFPAPIQARFDFS